MTGRYEVADDAEFREYDYGDEVVYAADFGADGDATVDVVDATAIVVADGEQYDVELPSEDARAFIRNGVLTIEVNK